jgi:LacI family transcriptional regulator
MPTLNDVAKLAGVAPITVSRVINDRGYISQATRAKVETAIAELGYVPNVLARGLRSKRTHTLALVMTDITNPFFTMMARGVEDAASQDGYTVIFCNTDEAEAEEEKYANILAQKQVDGILLVPARSNSKTVEFFQANEIPVVVIDRRIPGFDVDSVRCDSRQGAYDLTRLLVELGHQRIAMITGPEGVSTSDDRVTGYRQALNEAGLSDYEKIFYGSYTQAGGYDLAIQAMQQVPAPSALFGANNFISIGILKALRALDLRVPEDIAVVSFDDLPDSLVIDPILTVAAQPAYEMGQKATQLLLERISGEVAQEHQEVILPIEIIVRKTSG